MTSNDPLRRPRFTIRPPSGIAIIDLAEIWAYRDLLFTLAARDVTLRYRQTALGIIWVLVQPLVGAGLFTWVFGNLAGLSKGTETNYFLLTFAGQVFYTAFATTLTRAGASLVGNTGLVSKVYFPRLVLPLSAVASAVLDFGVGLCLLLLLLIPLNGIAGLPILLLPLWIVLSLILSLGWGLIASALMVSYRDVAYILPVLLQFLNFGSPVGWSMNRIGADWLPVYLLLNPLAVFLEGFRWSLFSRNGSSFPIPVVFVVYAIFVSALVFVAGTLVFRNQERRFADVI